MQITFLGTGASSGTPIPGCDCRVCGSRDPRDKRLRPSLLVEWNGRQILVDTPPELRLQLLAAGVKKIDAILFTHCHADHVYGMDDVRIFSKERKIPVLADKSTLVELKKIFPYVFKRTQKAGGKPRLKLKVVEGPFYLFGLRIVPLKVFHGNKQAKGFRFGRFAYIPDCNRIPSRTFSLLKDLDVLGLDALRETPSPTHFSIPEAIRAAQQIGAKRTLFTHINHTVKHAEMKKKLPRNIELAHDSLKIYLPSHKKG